VIGRVKFERMLIYRMMGLEVVGLLGVGLSKKSFF
jgi:hypothetical protein